MRTFRGSCEGPRIYEEEEMEHNLVEILRQHGPMTAKDLEEKVKWTGVLDALCELKKQGRVYQPRKRHWAASSEEFMIEFNIESNLRLYLDRYHELKAKGYDVAAEIAEYEARLAAIKKEAA